MEMARDVAEKMRDEGRGVILDQFANPDNPLSHYESTGPEIWRETGGRVTHFVSSMGTTGTIMGVSQYLKEKNRDIQIVGCQPSEGSQIPGIRKWPEAYLPKICDWSRVARFEPWEVDGVPQRVLAVSAFTFFRTDAPVPDLPGGKPNSDERWLTQFRETPKSTLFPMLEKRLHC